MENDLAKRIKSKKYIGIYYRELKGGDKVFEFTYKTIDGKKEMGQGGFAIS